MFFISWSSTLFKSRISASRFLQSRNFCNSTKCPKLLGDQVARNNYPCNDIVTYCMFCAVVREKEVFYITKNKVILHVHTHTHTHTHTRCRSDDSQTARHLESRERGTRKWRWLHTIFLMLQCNIIFIK